VAASWTFFKGVTAPFKGVTAPHLRGQRSREKA
jgi:hypothetical protein